MHNQLMQDQEIAMHSNPRYFVISAPRFDAVTPLNPADLNPKGENPGGGSYPVPTQNQPRTAATLTAPVGRFSIQSLLRAGKIAALVRVRCITPPEPGAYWQLRSAAVGEQTDPPPINQVLAPSKALTQEWSSLVCAGTTDAIVVVHAPDTEIANPQIEIEVSEFAGELATAYLAAKAQCCGCECDAATIAVGTTTTLAPGNPATVVNSGTPNAAVFDFGIPAGPAGPAGPSGAPGAPGAAATIAVGTTTTLAPGNPATVVNSGTPNAAVFDFGIPAGPAGPAGPSGAGLDFSVNNAAVDVFPGAYVTLRAGGVIGTPNVVGAYTGGGVGNKSIWGVQGFNGLPLGALTDVSFVWRNIVGPGGPFFLPPGAATVTTPYINLIVDFAGTIRVLVVLSDSLNGLITNSIGTYINNGSNQMTYSWTNAQNVLIVNSPVLPVPGGVPPAVTVGPTWLDNSYNFAALVAANPTAVLRDAYPADGGLPAGAILPSVLFISGDSGNLTRTGKQLIAATVNGGSVLP